MFISRSGGWFVNAKSKMLKFLAAKTKGFVQEEKRKTKTLDEDINTKSDFHLYFLLTEKLIWSSKKCN